MPGSLVSDVADCEAPELGNSFTAGKFALAGNGVVDSDDFIHSIDC